MQEGTIFTGYDSDCTNDEESEPDEGDVDDDTHLVCNTSNHDTDFPVRAPPPLKRRRLDVPARSAKQARKEKRQKDFAEALIAIEKLVRSKRNVFAGGSNGLQACRARAIQSCLGMVANNNRGLIDASKRAAESQGFAENWGGRMVRSWVQAWVESRKLPASKKGRHVKSFSLLCDPAISAELRSYVRSNKWSMDPSKLAEFSQNKMVPEAAEKYVRHIVNVEMPQGLKRYLEVELFPRIHLKVGRGITIRTARRWLHREGFRYTEHKKSLYYDGHERPDVIKYRQEVFLPAMAEYRKYLVEYVVGDVDTELQKPPLNFVERRLVLVAHDESTSQANDGRQKGWVLDGEHPLKKKGSRARDTSKRRNMLNCWLVSRSQSKYGVWKELRRILDRRAVRQTGQYLLFLSGFPIIHLFKPNSLSKKLSQHLNVHMALVTGL